MTPSSPDPFGEQRSAINSQIAPAGPGAVATIGGPPIGILVGALVAAAIGLVCGIVAGHSGPIAIVAWVLAGPVAIGVLSVFTIVDTRRRALPIYTQPTWITTVYWAVLLVAGVGIIVGALRVAFWAGRL